MREVEFLPERIRQQRARRRRLVRQGYLLMACIMAMGLLTYVNSVRVARADGDLTRLNDHSRNLARRIEMIRPLERELAELLIKQRIELELGSRTDCTAVLAELCRIMPANMALVSLDLKSMDVRIRVPNAGAGSNRSARASVGGQAMPATRTVRRARLVITGLAPTNVDVANFIGQLSGSCVFEDVKMGYAKTAVVGNRTAREFQASCYLAR
ncbi:MAG: PilN domain-containing protein [Planctomycetota bacterium]|jgi:Tfp pilus assembly protein PilN